MEKSIVQETKCAMKTTYMYVLQKPCQKVSMVHSTHTILSNAIKWKLKGLFVL